MNTPEDLERAMSDFVLAVIIWQESKSVDGHKMVRESITIARELLDKMDLPENEFEEGYVIGAYETICNMESIRERKAFKELKFGAGFGK